MFRLPDLLTGENVLGRLVPIPSIAIEGELVFETTPSVEELKACIHKFINKLQ